jgi:hypothetical protein
VIDYLDEGPPVPLVPRTLVHVEPGVVGLEQDKLLELVELVNLRLEIDVINSSKRMNIPPYECP